MSREVVERIANAILYEGYVLYPYRASSVKNQRRFNFGVLVPPAYAAAEHGTEAFRMQTECLISGGSDSVLDVRVRFLQVLPGSWQNAMERNVVLQGCRMGGLMEQQRRERFHFDIVQGVVNVSAEQLGPQLFRISAHVVNETPLELTEVLPRDDVLPYSLAAAHTILELHGGEFISLLDPPEEHREAARACQNTGTWPVLAGEPEQRAFMLSSPIILYDYPQIAPESPGDLFDGTEIDEILTLRILTLSDEEKDEIRNGDERARRILERTEMLPEEHLQKLHGALRGLRPVEGSH